MNQDTDLSAIDEGDVSLTIDGKKVDIQPIRIKQIRAITALVEPIYEEANKAFIDGMDFMSGLKLVSDHLETFCELLSLLTDLQRDDLEGMELDDFFKVVIAVFQVNKDFFIKRLMPAITSSLEAMTVAVNQETK